MPAFWNSSSACGCQALACTELPAWREGKSAALHICEQGLPPLAPHPGTARPA